VLRLIEPEPWALHIFLAGTFGAHEQQHAQARARTGYVLKIYDRKGIMLHGWHVQASECTHNNFANKVDTRTYIIHIHTHAHVRVHMCDACSKALKNPAERMRADRYFARTENGTVKRYPWFHYRVKRTRGAVIILADIIDAPLAHFPTALFSEIADAIEISLT